MDHRIEAMRQVQAMEATPEVQLTKALDRIATLERQLAEEQHKYAIEVQRSTKFEAQRDAALRRLRWVGSRLSNAGEECTMAHDGDAEVAGAADDLLSTFGPTLTDGLDQANDCTGNCGRVVDEEGEQVHEDPECPMNPANQPSERNKRAIICDVCWKEANPDHLSGELERLRADRERLDWLDKKDRWVLDVSCGIWSCREWDSLRPDEFQGTTARQAIDAACEGEKDG